MLSEKKRIRTKEDLQKYIKVECERYGVSTRFLFAIRENEILARHNIVLRKAEYHINTGHKLRSKLFLLWLSRIQNKYSIHVPVNCCGIGLKIMHIGPVLINNKTSIGDYCTFHINTAVVAGGTNDKVPILGNHVILGVGAVIGGEVVLADYIAVGANAYVNKSFFEENIAIAGVPAKKISNNGTKSWNKKNKIQ